MTLRVVTLRVACVRLFAKLCNNNYTRKLRVHTTRAEISAIDHFFCQQGTNSDPPNPGPAQKGRHMFINFLSAYNCLDC